LGVALQAVRLIKYLTRVKRIATDSWALKIKKSLLEATLI